MGDVDVLGQTITPISAVLADVDGTLVTKENIDDLSVTGLTSNPTIFEQAIKNSPAYDIASGAVAE